MIIFRADANETVATGHLMRCMTIADACREKGMECEFWLAEDKETERLRQAGFSYRILGSQWDDLEKELPFLERQAGGKSYISDSRLISGNSILSWKIE